MHQPNYRISRATFLAGLGLLLFFQPGCFRGSENVNPAFSLIPNQLDNPLFVPVVDANLLWDQLSNELDDYFVIKREDRVRIVGNEITEGWIETYPTSGSTILEPWRKDSTSGFEKHHATLQTIRRWSRVRVIPTAGGFLLEVFVYKELEDLEQPQNSNVGGEVLRYDNSLSRMQTEQLSQSGSSGWISIGRDNSLEQYILANLLGRLTDPAMDGGRAAINTGQIGLTPQ